MAKQTFYLTDDLDQRIRGARLNGGVNVSGACQLAVSYAISNGDQALTRALSQGPAAEPGHQVPAHGGRVDRIEQLLQRLVTAVGIALAGIALLALASLVTIVSVRALATT